MCALSWDAGKSVAAGAGKAVPFYSQCGPYIDNSFPFFRVRCFLLTGTLTLTGTRCNVCRSCILLFFRAFIFLVLLRGKKKKGIIRKKGESKMRRMNGD
jgi:hypothetical protein